MSEEELKQYWGKKVELTTNDGHYIKGVACYFADSYDNDPDEASLTFKMPYGNVEVGLSEIAEIKIVK